ncbi:DUF5342 family protein [Psychrobacillus sp. OK032]|uniref:DUF5342 family protein n=1 Tax=Psychrobacillus sp. OK032 TaxID=1884358 RepID=UPI0008C8BFAD|nr:DUF5342 family protein [Psychrobacillus sp. OK032]SES37659.1 hypothetical protein SAMN05518872_10990 [Psychrobacillus sp. OK032]
MIENFQYEKEIYDGLPHEVIQFSFTIKEYKFSGHYKDGEIKWFHPQPGTITEEIVREEVEAAVLKEIRPYIS